MSNTGCKYLYAEGDRTQLTFQKGVLECDVESQVTFDEYYDGYLALNEVETYKLFLTMKEYYNE